MRNWKRSVAFGISVPIVAACLFGCLCLGAYFASMRSLDEGWSLGGWLINFGILSCGSIFFVAPAMLFFLLTTRMVLGSTVAPREWQALSIGALASCPPAAAYYFLPSIFDDAGDDRSYLTVEAVLLFFVSMAVIGGLTGFVLSAISISGDG